MGDQAWDAAYESFIEKYESGSLNESLSSKRLLEYFKASRLTTVAKILDATTSADQLKAQSTYYQKIGK